MRIVLIINKGIEQKCERKVQKYKERAEKSKDNAAFAISSNESDGDTRQVNSQTSSSVKIQSKNLNFKSS
jgi:hypothetical protein